MDNSKNADYGAAEQYLLFEHDEFTMKPVLDETGRLIPREDYRISSLNCGGDDFAVACMRVILLLFLLCLFFLHVKNLFCNLDFGFLIRWKHDIQNDSKQCCRYNS